ncbi:ATP-binding cassette domain-containing protein [Streptomyces flaveus]|uniref:ABC transporter ATP-binding protein n=1 Tax=Streptomyces flaveus TaxID=66370 RepID=A0A917RE68_9ACTN|nr:ABC transporter ATP-binding protein [Streptomyces flaveus]GGL02170.1 ABC transporter ATP-binding protein [Streptomyces flaveus]
MADAARGVAPEETECGLRDAALAFLRRHKAAVAALAGWSVLEAGQAFLLGIALARALDDGFLRARPDLGLAWLAAAAVSVIAAAFGTGRAYRALAGLVEPLRDALVRRVVSGALKRAAAGPHRTDASAVSRLTQQVELARDTFAGVTMAARSFVFTAAGALAGLFALDPLLLAVVMPPLVAGLGLFVATLGPLARRQEAYLATDEDLARQCGDLACGLRDVTATGAEDVMAEETDALIAAEFRASRSLARWEVSRVLAIALAGRLPVILLLGAAPWLLRHGVTAGALAGALVYVTQSLLPALHNLTQGLGTAGTRLGAVLRRLWADPVSAPPGSCADQSADSGGAAGAADAARLTAPGGTGSQAVRAAHPAPYGPSPASRPPAVELDRVTFAHGDHTRPVVRDLHLTLPEGEHLAVVGPSGIGKSTLVGLIAGLLSPHSGQARIAGVPVSGRTAEELAALRVLIPQEAYVFSGTLRDNLLYLCPEPPPDGTVQAAVACLGLDALADRLGGLDSSVDPSTLSTGEAQLIALARAYLSPAPLALLDEATCHLDPTAEARAELAFARRPGTLVIIAHRITSAQRAGRILVMDGAHVQWGTHDELLTRSPLYRDMVGHWDTTAFAAGGGHR